MATSVASLLRSLRERAATAHTAAMLPDLTGAIGHLGRGLHWLAEDGITATEGDQQRTVLVASSACTAIGRLWPNPAGPLSDLAGTAADLVGLDSRHIGRAQRWAVAVELAETADSCADRVHRLLPNAAGRRAHTAASRAGPD